MVGAIAHVRPLTFGAFYRGPGQPDSLQAHWQPGLGPDNHSDPGPLADTMVGFLGPASVTATARLGLGESAGPCQAKAVMPRP